MANYTSSLHGSEIDEALRGIVDSISERYAKGTAKGVPVAPGTPGYQDNSKYWAQIAEQIAENVKNYIEGKDVSAAVRWDVDQSLTKQEQETAQSNIGLDDVLRYTDQLLSPGMIATVLANLGLLDVLRSSAQMLTAEQKNQVLSNIGAQASDNYVKYSSQSLNSSEKKRARKNIAASGQVMESSATLLASKWSNGVYPISYIADDYEVEMQISDSATPEMVEAYANAMMTGVQFTNNIKALGEVPTIDIAVTLFVREK